MFLVPVRIILGIHVNVPLFQNDPGINGHFSTYMKARIFCEREVPPGRQFNGAVDYHYNEIRKLMIIIDVQVHS